METHQITLKNGRILAYTGCGDSEKIPVFHVHRGPGSRLEGKLFERTAAQRRYRIFTTDRPGIGESTYRKGRRLPDYPANIAALTDNPGIETFRGTGWSGGAHMRQSADMPYQNACSLL